MIASAEAGIVGAEGTCIQLTESERVWAVRGRQGWYRCDAERKTCSCPAFLYRRRGDASLAACRHLRMLTAYLIARATLRELAEADPMAQPLPPEGELRRVFS